MYVLRNENQNPEMQFKPKTILLVETPFDCKCHIGYRAPFSDVITVTLFPGWEIRIGAGSLGYDNYHCTFILPKEEFEKLYLSDRISDQFYDGFSIEAEVLILEANCKVLELGDISKLDLSINEDRQIFLGLFRKELLTLLPEKISTSISDAWSQFEANEITYNEFYNRSIESLHGIKDSYKVIIDL